MRKANIFILLFVMIFSLETVCVEAHQNAEEHYEELEAMLFGTYKYNEKDIQTNVEILKKASTLCIDQFGASDEELLTNLKKWGVKGIISDISEINPDESNPIKLAAKNHRTYTHQGWDYNYTGEKYGDLANWPERKNILLASAEKVFDFSVFSGEWLFLDFGYSDKCDSFCALIYYNHLLGDYLEDINSKDGNIDRFNGQSNGKKIPFASDSLISPDIFSELEKHIAILFEDQSDSRVYASLMSDIETLAGKARNITGNEEGTVTEENYKDIGVCVRELMDILTGENSHYNAIHELLEKEKFFKDVFPS